MPRIEVEPGMTLHFEVFGESGPWVVLLMGLGASARLWGDLPERLAAEGYRVLTIDNRGVGRSDAPSRPFRIERMADDAAIVMDAAGIDRAFVVGVSMGGMIAQHLALRHAHRLLGLGLLSTTPGIRHAGLPHPRAIRSLLRSGVGSLAGEAIVADLLLARSQRHRARELLDELKALLAGERPRPLGFFAQFAASILHDPNRRLASIAVPTIVVTGDDDIVLPVRGSRFLARQIPNAMYEELPETGHGAPFSDRSVVLRMLARLRALR